MKSLEKMGIDPETQRRIGYVILGLLSLSYIWFLKPAFFWLHQEIYGALDVGTIIGALGAVFAWNLYKRWL